MLPFDQRPWAKTLATAVLTVCMAAAVVAAYVLYLFQELHVPEVLIILLLLLTIVPPNVAIALRSGSGKEAEDIPDALAGQQLHMR